MNRLEQELRALDELLLTAVGGEAVMLAAWREQVLRELLSFYAS